MILTKYEVNMTNSNPKISYVLSSLNFQNCHLERKMRITLEDGFSDFSGKHSDILQIFLHKNQKKNPLWYPGQPIMALGPV